MEIKKINNITDHALMKYCSRVVKDYIISKPTWQNFKKINASQLPIYEEELRKGLDNLKFICKASYNGNKTSEFYINKELMMTYVVNGENLITVYPIDFGLDEEDNKEMLGVLLNNLQRNLDKLAENEIKNKSKLELLTYEKNIKKVEIEELKASLKRAEEEKEKIDKEINLFELERKEIIEKMGVTEEKIARSKMAFTNYGE